MSKLPNLVWLRSFEAAARHMNFTAAALELGITQTALSLHVRSLEAQLGRPLFFRAARKLSLTEVGKAYSFSVRRALSDIDLSTTSLFGSNEKQELIVRVPISTATLFLTHRLPDFSQRHPDLSIRLVSNIWAESAVQDHVDVELRLGKGEWSDAPLRKISEERIVPIAPSEWGMKTPPLNELAQRQQVQILGLQDMWSRYLSAFDMPYSAASPSMAVDTTIAAVDIVAAGGGYALVLERFAKTAIETGRAISIVGEPISIERSHYLVGGQTSKPNDAARQIFESWIEQVFAGM